MIHDNVLDAIALLLDPVRLACFMTRGVLTVVGRASSRRAHDSCHGVTRDSSSQAAVPPSRSSAVARGPAVSARALLAGRERRNASRHARG
eukprot:5638397-Pleurochrysis_carterae.AAC.1